LELRSPDAASNPYLVLAVCLAAGLDGIKRGLTPPAGIDEGMAEPKELPTTLQEAIHEFKKDQFIQDVIGKHIADKYIETKSKEWFEYCEQVSAWEVDQYLYRI
jgi:Glutamine synthetase